MTSSPSASRSDLTEADEWREATHAVRLDQFPESLEFPEDLADRIRYDAVRKRLVFRGFMSKSTFDRLEALYDQGEYHRALQELFQRSTCIHLVKRPGIVTRLMAYVGVTTELLSTLVRPSRPFGE